MQKLKKKTYQILYPKPLEKVETIEDKLKLWSVINKRMNV